MESIRDRNVTETVVVSRERFLPQFCCDFVDQRGPRGCQEAPRDRPEGPYGRPRGSDGDPIRDRNVTQTGVVSRERFLPQFWSDSVAQRGPEAARRRPETAERGQTATQGVRWGPNP